MADYDVIVSEEARRQLGDCVLFIAKDNVEAAMTLRERLVSGIRSLSSMPGRFPFFNESYIPYNKYHKMFIEKYLVLYQISDEKVFVDYVIDCRREYQWLIH